MNKLLVGVVFSGLLISYSNYSNEKTCRELNHTISNLISDLNAASKNYDYKVESGGSMFFDYSHKGVTACRREDAIEHAESICKRKFNVPPSSHVAILLMEFENDFWTTGWPEGARKCKYYAQAGCEFIDY